MNYNFDIKVDNTEFDSVGSFSFDCKSIDITFSEGGGYFTSLPISPLKYRQENDTISRRNVKGHIENSDTHTVFKITDDWGGVHTISINNRFKKEIKKTIKAGKKEQILTPTP